MMKAAVNTIWPSWRTWGSLKLWGQPLLSQHFFGQVSVWDLGEDTPMCLLPTEQRARHEPHQPEPRNACCLWHLSIPSPPSCQVVCSWVETRESWKQGPGPGEGGKCPSGAEHRRAGSAHSEVFLSALCSLVQVLCSNLLGGVATVVSGTFFAVYCRKRLCSL